MTGARLKVLACLHSWYYFKNLAPVFERLHADGHELAITALNEDREDFERAVEAFRQAHPGIEIAKAPARNDGWMLLCWSLRQTIGFMHFMDPRFDAMPRLRQRITKRAGAQLQQLTQRRRYRSGLHRLLLGWLVRRLEAAVPPDEEVSRFLRDHAPDVLIVTPLIDLDGAQWDYLKSARALGIPTVFPVYSWDNLSSKTQLFTLPDRILVWNQRQVEEAVRYHGVPAGRIGVTGAQSFDEWFARAPSRDRTGFCGAVGLDPAKPLILYVGSATTRRDVPEPDFTVRWLRALRAAADPRLRQAGVVIRPHPKREHIWAGFDSTGLGPVVVHPQEGQLPIGEDAKRVYFDSLYHCDLVVGLNTSALIEAGIVGRPVFTVLDPAFAVDQTQTFHFPYLLDASQGLLSVARDFDEHLAQIAETLDRPEKLRERARQFVRSFVRPYGEEVAAAPLFERELLAAARARPVSARRGLLDLLLRWRMRHYVFNDQTLRFQSGKLRKLFRGGYRADDGESQDQPAE